MSKLTHRDNTNLVGTTTIILSNDWQTIQWSRGGGLAVSKNGDIILFEARQEFIIGVIEPYKTTQLIHCSKHISTQKDLYIDVEQ